VGMLKAMTKYIDILKEIRSILEESKKPEDRWKGDRRFNLQRLIVDERLNALLDLVNFKIDEIEQEENFYLRMTDQ
jgi:hypothetical protein